MHVDYEYILAGLVLLLILAVSEMNIFAVITHQLTRMEQEVEYSTAERILDMILLSPGFPPNWGNQSADPTSLGLAVQNPLRAYTLDISKVIRLKEDSLNYIPPGKARQLMGLSENYHFNLTIIPVFTIDIVNASSGGQAKYVITIKDYKGFRVPNVNVTGFYVPNSLTGGQIYPFKSAITGVDGVCVLTFNPSLPNRSLVVYASQLEVKALQTDPPDLKVWVEKSVVMKSDFPMIQTIYYYTGRVSGMVNESVFRYAEIEGVTYYVKFDLWR